MPAPDLGGAGILVTRPAHQATALIEAVEAAGGRPIAFPTLEIAPCADPAPVFERLRERWDWFIFVSVNAVTHGLALLRQSEIAIDTLNIAAVGRATAAALADAGIRAHTPPRNFNSEGLLALPELQAVSGQRILIFRGDEGREWLRTTLIERGATVEYAECYRRLCPQADPKPVLDACTEGILHVISSTSNQGLLNLLTLVTDHSCVPKLPILVVGERQADAAGRMGWQGHILVAPDPHPATLVATLITQRDNW